MTGQGGTPDEPTEDGVVLTAQQRKRIESVADKVGKMARNLTHTMPQVSTDDLISAGNEGLVQAALRYDPATEVPFSAFAHYRIRGAMIDCARRVTPAVRRRTRAMRAMESTQSLLQHAQREQAALDASTARSLKERVSAAADIVAQATAAIVLTKLSRVEPDRLASKAEGSAEEVLLSEELRTVLHETVAECPDEDRALIEALYFEGETMHTFAKRTGKSVSTVSRRHARVMRRLSSRMRTRMSR
ncbi:MAG: sigma-70 family RNA polymerase sigma factor [Myxococcota bacterium]